MTEPPRRRRGPPRALAATSAADAVASVIALHHLDHRMRAERLTTEWTELVGERIAARTRPAGVIDRVLVIEVASSAWLHELSLLRLQLLAGLVERIGPPRLFDELRFKLAGRDRVPPGAARRAPRPASPARSSTAPATGAAREQIVREAGAVDDAELRELIARVRIAHDR